MRTDKANLCFYLTIKNGDNYSEIRIPGVNKVCGQCRGKGTHVSQAIDGHGMSPAELHDDPNFAEAYFSGYDVRCEECHGNRVVLSIDWKKMSDEQHELVSAELEGGAGYAAECKAERDLGC